MWKSDNELFALMKTRLFTAVVGDILDTLGYMHQFVSPAIKPLDVNTVVAGRAMRCWSRTFTKPNRRRVRRRLAKTVWHHV